MDKSKKANSMEKNIDASSKDPSVAIVPGEKHQAQVPAEDKKAKEQSGGPCGESQEGNQNSAPAKAPSVKLNDGNASGPSQSNPENAGESPEIVETVLRYEGSTKDFNQRV